MNPLPQVPWFTNHSVRYVERTSAPPSVYWVEEEVRALRDAIREHVVLQVLGRGKDWSELWDGYGDTVPVFSDMRSALVRLYQLSAVDGDIIRPDHLGRLIGRRVEESGLDVDVDSVEYIVTTGQRNLIRGGKTIKRLQKQGLDEAFFETDHGRQWPAATLAFAWGLMGLRMIVDDTEGFSPEDLHFCLQLMRCGPRDSYSFARCFELDQEEESEQEEFEFPSDALEMADELAKLEQVEFEEGEKLLRAIEDHGAKETTATQA